MRQQISVRLRHSNVRKTIRPKDIQSVTPYPDSCTIELKGLGTYEVGHRWAEHFVRKKSFSTSEKVPSIVSLIDN